MKIHEIKRHRKPKGLISPSVRESENDIDLKDKKKRRKNEKIKKRSRIVNRKKK